VYKIQREKGCGHVFTRYYTNRVRWAIYNIPGCQLPLVYLCQKLWKLADSRQRYCRNVQA